MVVDYTRLTAGERRSAILAAARHEFASRGFRGARTAAIASGAGCSEPTLYKHFPSKQALFAAVLRDATESMKEMVDALKAEAGDAMSGMLAVAERATSDPLIIETIRLRTMAAGQAAGEIRSDIDPDNAAWILYGYTLAGGHAHAVHGNAALGEFVAVAE